jgi:hypothetical protein
MSRNVSATEILEAARPPMRRHPASIEDRLADLEYAHAVLAVQMVRVMSYNAGWSDDDMAGFIVHHADVIREYQGPPPAPGVRDTPLLIHLDNMAAGLGGEFAR